MLDVAAVVPASALGGERAGGWCEVRGLDDGRAALMVGHALDPGPPFADTLRTNVLDRLGDGDLAGALELADRSALVCLALLDPATGSLEHGATGRRSPLVVRGAGPAAALHTVEPATVGPEDVLLLYDDGGATVADVDDPVLRSTDRVSYRGGRATEELCRHILAELDLDAPGHRAPVLLAARRTSAPEPFDVTLPATSGSTGLILSAARDWLRLLGVSLRDRIAVDAVLHELCQNVVRHAYPVLAQRRPLRAQLRLAPTGVLETSVTDEGRWTSDDAPGSPRLALARAASDTLVVHVERAGGRAVATHRVSREGPHVARPTTAPRRRRPAADGW